MITLIPVGGLANRIRTIAAALALAQHGNHRLRIVWFKDAGLNCRFDHLFQQPDAFPRVEVRDASWLDLWRHDRPRRRNFFLPRIAQRFLFDSCIYEQEMPRLMQQRFDFAAWAGDTPDGRNVYAATYTAFLHYPPRLLKEFFAPLPQIQQQADDIARHFDRHTIGVHIRRTDNTHSIALSPLTLFARQLQKEIEADPLTRFYVASDSPRDKEELRRQFGSRILTHDFSAARHRPEGIRDALAELLVLSSTQKIIGSCWSSYSEIAAQLSGIPCVILKKETL